jgi:hypothetical protein
MSWTLAICVKPWPSAIIYKKACPLAILCNIFYVQSGAEAEAIDGSANPTKGGSANTYVTNIYVKSAANETFFKQVRTQLATEAWSMDCRLRSKYGVSLHIRGLVRWPLGADQVMGLISAPSAEIARA